MIGERSSRQKHLGKNDSAKPIRQNSTRQKYDSAKCQLGNFQLGNLSTRQLSISAIFFNFWKPTLWEGQLCCRKREEHSPCRGCQRTGSLFRGLPTLQGLRMQPL